MEGMWIVLILLGLAAGVCGGLLGVGGSIVIIPGLIELYGPDQHLFQATAMIVNVFVVVPATIQHVRLKAVDWSIVVRLVPAAVAGVLAGVMCSEVSFFAGVGQAYLIGLFAVFLVYAASYDLYRIFGKGRPLNPEDYPMPPLIRIGTVGLLVGFSGGLLGVGGGLVAVPLQRRILRIPLRIAIANSAATIIIPSSIGAILKNSMLSDHGHAIGEAINLAAILIPTAIIGSILGSGWTHRVPRRMLHVAFAVLLVGAAVRLGQRSYAMLSSAGEISMISPDPTNSTR